MPPSVTSHDYIKTLAGIASGAILREQGAHGVVKNMLAILELSAEMRSRGAIRAPATDISQTPGFAQLLAHAAEFEDLNDIEPHVDRIPVREAGILAEIATRVAQAQLDDPDMIPISPEDKLELVRLLQP